VININCPQCNNPMIQTEVKKPNLTLEGLPTNINKLMEVVEYWDSDYSLTPMSLHFWFCEQCASKVYYNKAKYCNFVIFKDNSLYGFTGSKWEKFVAPIVPFQFR